MSISQTRNFIEKSGCGLLVGIVMAIVFGLSVFYSCGRSQGANNGAEQDQGASTPIASIREYVVTPVSLSMAADNQGAQSPDRTPMGMFNREAGALFRLVNDGALLELAQKYGVSLSDEQMIQSSMSEVDRSIDAAKGQLIQAGKLKATSSPAEFDAEFKKVTGKTVAEFKDDFKKRIEEDVKDPQKRSQLLASLLNDAIRTKIEGTLKPTEDEIKSQFRNYTVKRINFGQASLAADLKGKAEEVLAKIKGGMSFEQAIDDYSQDPATPGKKKSETSQDVPASIVDAYKVYEPLKGLKAGETTGAVDFGGNIVILKLVKVSDNIPQDYEKNKDNYKKSYLQSKASQQMAKELADITKSGAVKWSSPSYKLMYDYTARQLDPSAPSESPKERQARLLDIAKQAKEQASKDPLGAQAAKLLRFAILETLWNTTLEAERKAFRDERLDAIKDVLEASESVQLRLDLADAYMDMNKNQEAYEQLLAASRANSDLEGPGQSNYGQIQSRIQKMIDLKLITPEQKEDLQAAQTRWVTDKAQSIKEQAELKKQQEADKKQLEEDKKRMEQEQKAASSGSGATSPPATSTGATTGK